MKEERECVLGKGRNYFNKAVSIPIINKFDSAMLDNGGRVVVDIPFVDFVNSSIHQSNGKKKGRKDSQCGIHVTSKLLSIFCGERVNVQSIH